MREINDPPLHQGAFLIAVANAIETFLAQLPHKQTKQYEHIEANVKLMREKAERIEAIGAEDVPAEELFATRELVVTTIAMLQAVSVEHLQ